MKGKKIIELVISFFALLSLVACASKPTISSSPAQSNNTEPEVAITKIEVKPLIPTEALYQKLKELEVARKYVSSEPGKSYYSNGFCAIPHSEKYQALEIPENACATEIELVDHVRETCKVDSQCDLVSALLIQNKIPKNWNFISALGCSYSDEEQTLLASSTDSMAKLYCTAGGIKLKNKYLKLFGSIFRSASCSYSLQNIVKKSNRLASCMEDEAVTCKESATSWFELEAERKENHALKMQISRSKYSVCETKTKVLKDVRPPSDDNIIQEIERIESVISDRKSSNK